jgi:hypothetical protein
MKGLTEAVRCMPRWGRNLRDQLAGSMDTLNPNACVAAMARRTEVRRGELGATGPATPKEKLALDR